MVHYTAYPLLLLAACWSAGRAFTPLHGTAKHNTVQSCSLHFSSAGANRRLAQVIMAGSDGGGEQDARRPWPVQRFLRTLFFYNRPPSLKDLLSRPSEPPAMMQSSQAPPGLDNGDVLVTGATGGVGKRVVDLLRKRGIKVKALARNRSKALAMLAGGQEPQLGGGLDIVLADIRDPATLRPELFQGVIACVSCTAALVMPKEGDGPDRAKYYQGIKFFEPEVKDVPEETEYRGLVNLVEALQKYSDINGKTLFSNKPGLEDKWKMWGSLDDVVMGGVSEGALKLVAGETEQGGQGSLGAVFSGVVSASNSGGFSSVRTRNFQPPLDLRGYDAITLRVKGDGKRYKFIMYDTQRWDGASWSYSFDTVRGDWMDVEIPLDKFRPIFRSKTVRDGSVLQAGNIHSFQLMLSKFEYDSQLNPTFTPGQFSISIESIKASQTGSIKTSPLPRLVHVSSAGVTRPGRPGLDIEKEPPAVRMNDMLGGLLTYKLKGEDVIRSSGLPYTVVRPCALTEEAPGAPLIVSQGDEIKGKISRNDVAELLVEALLSPEAQGKTLEVKSDLAFSDVWTPDRTVGLPPRQYRNIFGGLKPNITGKEWMTDVSAPTH